jgi:hypothetical protein
LTGYTPSDNRVAEEALAQSRRDLKERRAARRSRGEIAVLMPQSPKRSRRGVVTMIVVAWFVLVPIFVTHPWWLLIFAPPLAVGLLSLGYVTSVRTDRTVQAKDAGGTGEVTESGAVIW